MKSVKTILTVIVVISILPLFADKVQDFTADDIYGNSINLYEKLSLGPVILDFWATWCKPCLKSLPHLNEIHTKYDDITVITVSVDKARKAAEVNSTVKSNRFEFITIHDTSKQLQKLMNVSMVPRTFVIDPEGEIVLDHNTYNKGDEKEIEEAALHSLPEKTGEPETESESIKSDDCSQN